MSEPLGHLGLEKDHPRKAWIYFLGTEQLIFTLSLCGDQ